MEEPNPFKTSWKRGHGLTVFCSCLVLSWFTAFSFGANQDAPDAKIDYAMAQQDILRFEQVINDVVNSEFSSSSFAVVQRPKGAYLPGYGINLQFLINIHQAVIRTPFGNVVRSKKADFSPDAKKRRIEDLKERLIRALQENGEVIRQLRKDDSVTIVAFIEDRNFPDEPNANKTIVLKTTKRDLDELGNKTERLNEFKQRMKIVEY